MATERQLAPEEPIDGVSVRDADGDWNPDCTTFGTGMEHCLGHFRPFCPRCGCCAVVMVLAGRVWEGRYTGKLWRRFRCSECGRHFTAYYTPAGAESVDAWERGGEGQHWEPCHAGRGR